MPAIASAQTSKPEYEPEVGGDGKDVGWYPTDQAVVDAMLDLAEIAADDFVIDLGSGDGRTVISAAQRGARALGIEYESRLVELSRRNAARAGVSERTTFVEEDLFECDLSRATVITMFLLPEINLELRPRILDLAPGTRIVSNTFTMGDWQADDSVLLHLSTFFHTALLWVVPAKVEGTWSLPEGDLVLDQDFQMVSGRLEIEGAWVPIASGRLRGNLLSFTANGAEYAGQVSDQSIEGTLKKGGESGDWSARRETESE